MTTDTHAPASAASEAESAALRDAEQALADAEAEYRRAKAEALPRLEAVLATATERIAANTRERVKLEREYRVALDARDEESRRVSQLQRPLPALRVAAQHARRAVENRQNGERYRALVAADADRAS